MGFGNLNKSSWIIAILGATLLYSHPVHAGRKYDQLKTDEDRLAYLENKINKLLTSMSPKLLCHDQPQFDLERKIIALEEIVERITLKLEPSEAEVLQTKLDDLLLKRKEIEKHRARLDREKKELLSLDREELAFSSDLSPGERSFIQKTENPSPARFYDQFYRELSKREEDRMKNTPPVLGLGENFQTVDPDSNPGVESNYSPLIKTAHENSLSKEKTPYDIYFERSHLIETNHSKTAYARRVTGYVFAGNRRSPTEVRSQGGFMGYAFDPIDHDSNGIPNPRKKYEAEYGNTSSALNITRYLEDGKAEAFRSTSTSPTIAKEFANKDTNVGYVYVVLANRGIDASDSKHIKNNHSEFEVTIPGSIPWGEIVGYRQVVKVAEGNHQFMGPVFLREGLQQKDPKAYEKIRRGLSINDSIK